MSSLRLRQEIKSRRSRNRRIESGFRQDQNGSLPAFQESAEPDIIACIDIGTTFSGYAFALSKDLQEDRLAVHVNKEWISGNSKLITLKVPSSVLLTPEKRFHSFGYEAEWKYGQLAADKNHLGWYYFRKFKMTMMQNENPNIGTSIMDDTGKPLRAVAVFCAAIKYLRNHLVDALASTMKGVEPNWILENFSFQWIFTHPVNWEDQTKQVITMAAKQVGINNATLVPEAEAASFYCQVSPLHRINTRNGEMICLQTLGMKYLMLDLGGGSTDSTILQLTNDTKLIELINSTGNLNGGIKVDAAFINFLMQIVNEEVMEKFASSFKADLSYLHKEFEIKKRTFDPKSSDLIVFKLPTVLRRIFEVNMKQALQLKIEQSEYGYLVKLNGDTLSMDPDVFRGFYAAALENISSSLLKVLYAKEGKDCKTIVMVGGFALSPLVQNTIRTKFPDMTILMPPDPDLAVMKGGVLYGFDNQPVIYMKAKYTYGIGMAMPFKNGVHPDEKKFESNGVSLCSDVFKINITQNQDVQIGEFESRTLLYINRREQRFLCIPVYLSTVREALFTTEGTCQYLGKMKITLMSTRDEKAPISVKMALTFHELVVEVTDEGSGRTIRDVFADSPHIE